MRLLLLFSVCLSLLCAACSGDEVNMKARTETLPAFSLTLPDGWVTNLPEGMECTAARCIAGFARAASGSRSAITVSVVPNLGKELAEIAAESTANMASHEAVMNVVSQTDTRVEYKGTIKESPARLVATIDRENQQVGILLLVGGEDELDAIVSTLRMKNARLNFTPAAAR